MFLSMNAASQAMKNHTAKFDHGPGPAAPGRQQQAPAQARTAGHAAAPAPGTYTNAAAKNPFSQFQALAGGVWLAPKGAGPTKVPAKPEGKVPANPATGGGAWGMGSAADLQARTLANDPKLAAQVPDAIRMIRKLPAAEQNAFASKMIADSSIAPAQRYEMLQKLTAPGAGGRKSAVTLDDLVGYGRAQANTGMMDLLSDPDVGAKMGKQIGKTASADTQNAMANVATGGKDGVALRSLLSGASKAQQNRTVGRLTGKDASPEQRELVAYAAAWMDKSERKAFAKNLTPENRNAVANAALDSLTPDGFLGSEAAKTMTDLVGGMKPRERTDFLRNAYDTPGRGEKLERLSKESGALVDPALTFGD